MSQTEDVRIQETQPLDAPEVVHDAYPMTVPIASRIQILRRQIARIVTGEDSRCLIVVGPCSIHDEASALEYGARLAEAQQAFQETLLLVMRVYFEKPRTSIGWKGYLNDPDLNGSFNINKGLRSARQLLLTLNQMGVPCGTEFLDVISPQYYADLIAWGAIGARTTESQVHRELASGLSAPIGFKNGTDGNIQIAIDAIRSARASHHFLSITQKGRAAIFKTSGNPDTHMVLRGSHEAPNCDRGSIQKVVAQLQAHQLEPRVMVDCSHGNSQREYKNQKRVAQALAQSIAEGSQAIMGVMMESHLHSGNQPFTLPLATRLEYGKSITDPCIDWESTLELLKGLSCAVAQRSQRSQIVQKSE